MKYMKLIALAGVIILAGGMLYGCLEDMGQPPAEGPEEPVIPQEPGEAEENEGTGSPDIPDDAEDFEGFPVP